MSGEKPFQVHRFKCLFGTRCVRGTAVDNGAPSHAIPLKTSPLKDLLLTASVSTVMAALTHRDASHRILGLVLWCWIVFHNGFHFLLISLTISLEEVVCIGLRWRIGVWVIEKVLDSE